MLKMSEATRKYKKIFCPHCDRDVSKSTWYSHYGQFYNNRKKEWTKFEDQHSKEAFDFGAAPPDGSSGKLNASQGASDPDDQTSHIIVGGQVDFSVPESGMLTSSQNLSHNEVESDHEHDYDDIPVELEVPTCIVYYHHYTCILGRLNFVWN